MPIRPENRALYPANWKEIRAAVLERAGNKCEECGVPNYAEGARDISGDWHTYPDLDRYNSDIGYHYWPDGYPDIIRIVLTVSHTDHDPTNNAPENLRALCQLHHNRHDAAHRAETRKATYQARREAKHGKQGTFLEASGERG